MSFKKIDISKAPALKPNVCGQRGKRFCKQQKFSAAAAHWRAAPS